MWDYQNNSNFKTYEGPTIGNGTQRRSDGLQETLTEIVILKDTFSDMFTQIVSYITNFNSFEVGLQVINNLWFKMATEI